MKYLIKILSIIGLAMTIVPSFLVFGGRMDLEGNKWWMMFGTLLWFCTSPFWMNKKTEDA